MPPLLLLAHSVHACGGLIFAGMFVISACALFL